jgi:nucleoside-diphosphate-sugar epimerase
MPLSRRRFVQSSLSVLALAAGGGGPSLAAAPPPRKKRILILGGTGFLGPAIVEVARARGHALTLFNRGKTRPDLFPDVEKLRGDRDGKLDALRGRKWDAVVDTSGYVPRIVSMSAELLAPGIERYVFISSISVYREDLKPGSDETAPVATMADPKNEDVRENYGALKALCEQAAEKAMPGRVVTVRPGLIVGPGDPTDRFTYWPVRLDQGGDVLAPGDGTDPAQVIDVRDLGAWLVELVERGETGVYNAVGPASPTTMRSMLSEVARGAGAKANLVWVPWPFLKKQGVAPWTDLPMWIPVGEPESGIASVSIARAVRKGLRFRPIAETAKDTLAWWRTLPDDRRSKLHAGLSREKEAAVLAAWRAESGGGGAGGGAGSPKVGGASSSPGGAKASPSPSR